MCWESITLFQISNISGRRDHTVLMSTSYTMSFSINIALWQGVSVDTTSSSLTLICIISMPRSWRQNHTSSCDTVDTVVGTSSDPLDHVAKASSMRYGIFAGIADRDRWDWCNYSRFIQSFWSCWIKQSLWNTRVQGRFFLTALLEPPSVTPSPKDTEAQVRAMTTYSQSLATRNVVLGAIVLMVTSYWQYLARFASAAEASVAQYMLGIVLLTGSCVPV